MPKLSIDIEALDNATSVVKGVGGALEGLGGIAAGVLTAGFAAAAAGAAVLVTGLGFAFSAALDNEKLQAQLAQTIKATGGAAGITAEEANILANQFKHLAGGSDDAILAIETLALRSGAITENEMPGFIQSVLDLGAVMGSTEAAAILLTRAEEDSIGAMGRLIRAGIIFTQDEKDKIKTLQESGQLTEANAVLMGVLAEATGGAAAANAATLSGQWEILKGTLGEAAETIGGPLLSAATELFDEFIKPVIPFVEDLAAAFALFLETLKGGDFGEAIDALGEFESVQAIFKALSVDIYSLEGAWNSLVTFIQGTLLPAIQPIIDAALNVAAAFREQMPMVQQTVKDMADFVINQINILSPTLITNITNTLNSIAAFWREHGDEIMAVVKVAFEFITVTIGGAMTLASGLISAAWQLINGDTRGAGETLKTTVTAFMNSVLSIVGQDLDKFTANWTAVWELTKIIWNTFWSDFIGTWTANWELAKIIVTTVVDKIKAAFTDIDWFAVGVGIVSGIMGGIVSMIASLVATAVSAALSAYNAAREALGLSSVSSGGSTGGRSGENSINGAATSASYSSQYSFNLNLATNNTSEMAAAFGQIRALAGAYP